ncbi:hypothetical protein T12_1806 [Trichinella patagoniensis]|uniref:Uncharacterized protein n=1 Tax=Trichinella patagoniensis TaxID=990121 RepID=A0A0V1AGF5_9BILA|nr:hypothetical protein T12_1806 [Trichinella patagoniensis]
MIHFYTNSSDAETGFTILHVTKGVKLENCDIMFDPSGCTVMKNKMTSEIERYPKDPLPEKNDFEIISIWITKKRLPTLAE